jgi:hypothetical protein
MWGDSQLSARCPIAHGSAIRLRDRPATSADEAEAVGFPWPFGFAWVAYPASADRYASLLLRRVHEHSVDVTRRIWIDETGRARTGLSISWWSRAQGRIMCRVTTTDLPTLVDSNPPASDALTRRPRWGWWGIAGLVGALLAGMWWVLVYQPMLTSDGGFGAGRKVGLGYDATTVDNVSGTEFRVSPPVPGDEIGLAFPLHNDGPLGITIVGIGNPFNPEGVVGAPIDWTSPGEATRTADLTGRETPLAPFALSGGGYTQVRLAFDVHDCATGSWAPGSGTTVDTVPITYRVLGLTRTVSVPLGYALTIDTPCGR